MVLFEPEIAPNTGNIIRLCANTGARLHLVGRLGFTLDAPRLRRAGLDYHEWASVAQHRDLDHYLQAARPRRSFAFTTRANRRFCEVEFAANDAFIFGPETRGLPANVLACIAQEQQLRIPMRPEARSLNLSNAVAVVCYEAWRQLAFVGAI